jgi:hypothetical protein
MEQVVRFILRFVIWLMMVGAGVLFTYGASFSTDPSAMPVTGAFSLFGLGIATSLIWM